jgi:ketosteroid isomerase-like protein
MERSAIEAALRDIYAARAANDAVATAAFFTPDAHYRVAGDPDRCAAVASYHGTAVAEAMELRCAVFHALEFSIATLTIDGDHAAVQCEATMRYTPTGQTITTRLAHFWTFHEGRASEVVEFFDTAAVAHLIADTPPEAQRVL